MTCDHAVSFLFVAFAAIAVVMGYGTDVVGTVSVTLRFATGIVVAVVQVVVDVRLDSGIGLMV